MATEYISLPQLSRREDWSLDTLRGLFRRRPEAAALLVRIGDRRFVRVTDIPVVRQMLNRGAA